MCLSIIFIIFGVSAIVNWDIAYTDLDSALVNWQMYKANAQFVGAALDKLTGFVPLILGIGIFLQIVGAILVFFGFKPKFGGFLLAIYIIFSTLIYYPFWFYSGEQLTFNLVLFLKNLAIFGGVLLLFRSRGRDRMNIEMIDDEG